MEVAEKLCDMLAIISRGKSFFGQLPGTENQEGEDGSLEKLFLELVDETEVKG